MATAAILNPAPHYQPQYPSYSSYSHQPSGPNMPAIISPVEPRRHAADEHEPPRQSLPSIQEVIGAKAPPAPAFPPSISTAVSGAPSLPSPFATSTNSRPYPDLSSPPDRHASPRSLHHPASYPPRSEAMPPFHDPNRPSLSARPAPPPVNTYHPAARPSPPPLKMESRAPERHAEGHRVNGYPHSAVSESTSLPYPQQPVQLPPGQLPLSAHTPMSPRYSSGPSLPSPFERSVNSTMHDDADYRRRGGDGKYEQALNRHFEAWQYQESLAKVMRCSGTFFSSSYANF